MCDVWCVMCDVWCVMYHVWFVMFDVWFVMHAVWCVMCDVWFVMQGVWRVSFDMWHIPTHVKTISSITQPLTHLQHWWRHIYGTCQCFNIMSHIWRGSDLSFEVREMMMGVCVCACVWCVRCEVWGVTCDVWCVMCVLWFVCVECIFSDINLYKWYNHNHICLSFLS